MDTGARVGYGYGLHVVSRDNIYTVSTHYLPCIYPVSTEYLRSIYTVSTHYLPNIYTVSQYLPSIYTVSTEYLHSIYPVSTQYLQSIIYPVSTQESRDPDTGDLAGEARLEDVALGEVWVCSGQSNMAWWEINLLVLIVMICYTTQYTVHICTGS